MKLAAYTGLFIMIFPVAVFALIKPARIILPEVAGVECVKDWLCLDDISRETEAQALYDEAKKRVEQKLTAFSTHPRVVFCSTMKCFANFGFAKAAGKSIAGLGVVIGPRGWKGYYIEHELIHQWQSSNFGLIGSWLAPKWITEGMAYALSDDPRAVLHEPFQAYKEKYNNIYGGLRGLALRNRLENDL